MKYLEYPPAEILRPYVKCFYTIEHESDGVVNDRAFAMGNMEFMFNLSDGTFETGRDSAYTRTPKAELWGQIIRPLDYRAIGKSKLLGVRFYAHTAALFLEEPVSVFNDGVTDVLDVLGKAATELHEKLFEAKDLKAQLGLLEKFLLQRLTRIQPKRNRFALVHDAVHELTHEDFFDNIENVAGRYGITSRYLQKLFLDYCGVSPKLYQKISRFQKSLQLTGKKEITLTAIAHTCGYFDQSHFVRDFKFFTGVTPSAFNPTSSSAMLIAGDR